jgi:integrase/recombinase XerD
MGNFSRQWQDLKQIKAISIKNEEGLFIGLEFKYNFELKELCRSIGASWDGKRKVWILLNTASNFNRMMEAFRDIAWIDIRPLRQDLMDRTLNRERRVEIDLDPLTEEELHLMKQRMQDKRYSQSTIKNYQSILMRYFSFHKGKESAFHEDGDINQFVHEVIINFGYSENYQRQLMGAIKLFYKYVHGEERELNAVPMPRRSKKLPVVLSADEVKRLIRACRNLKHRFCLSLIYGCGLRVGEALQLKRRDIDPGRLLLYVRGGKGRKDRTVVFPKNLVGLYHQYLEQYDPFDYVFEGLHGGAYSNTSINAVIKRCCKTVGIEKQVTAHTLRHSYATHLINQGVSLRHVQVMLGHNSSRTTEIYTHISEADLHQVESPFDRIDFDSN